MSSQSGQLPACVSVCVKGDKCQMSDNPETYLKVKDSEYFISSYRPYLPT